MVLKTKIRKENISQFEYSVCGWDIQGFYKKAEVEGVEASKVREDKARYIWGRLEL